jgi:nucleoside-diphosphate-sugar epimerase
VNCLVIGGTGFIGRALVKELLNAGHSVTLLHRRAKHDLGRRVKNIQADRNDGASMRGALAGKAFELVFDNVYDWERGTTAGHVESTARAVASDKLQRYIFMSSVGAYGSGLNHHEADALAPDDAPDLYVRNKAMSERALFRLHQRIGLPVVTLRPPYIYGPGPNTFYREAFFWDRLRAKRQIIVPGDGRRLMQFVHVDDLVRSAIKAAETPAAVGHAFNIANARPITQADLVETLATAARKKAEIVRIPRETIQRAGGSPFGPKFYFGQYFDMPPITQVTVKARRILKVKMTDYKDGVAESYRWYLRHRDFPEPDYAFEDKLLARVIAK